MKHADPRHNPNGWLAAVMLDLLEQDTKESKKLLADAIRVTTHGIEPGLIDELFWTWIESYVPLLDEAQSNQNNVDQQCSPEGRQE
jgi:hypothetical protein